MTRAATMLALLAFPALALSAPAHAGKFGGFSSDGRKYLDGDARVCDPVVVTDTGAASGAVSCARVDDKKQLAAHGFRKPKPARETPDRKLRLGAAFVDKTITLTASREGSPDVVLATWDAADPLASIADLYVSTDGSLVAIDFVAKTLRGDLPHAIAFDVRKPLAAAANVASVEKPTAKPTEPKPVDGDAFDRALKHGGVWEQALVACDQARVTLKLKKDRKFTIRIETRCQGDKWVTNLDGKWISEGSADVALTFHNDDGTVEGMPCTLGFDAATNEDTLSCEQDDVTFTLKPVRR